MCEDKRIKENHKFSSSLCYIQVNALKEEGEENEKGDGTGPSDDGMGVRGGPLLPAGADLSAGERFAAIESNDDGLADGT